MKSKYKKYIFLMLVLELMILATTAGAAISYFNQTETFEGENADEDPSDTWYSYTDLGVEYANVTSDTSYAGTKCFRMNDSTVTDGDVAYFNVTEAANYSYLEFYFKVDNTTHNESRIYCIDSAGTALARFDITVDSDEAYNVSYKNYTTTIWTKQSLVNNTWYKLRWDFNVTSDEIRGRLFNAAGTTLNDSWCPIEDGSGAYDYSNFKSLGVYGVDDEDIYIHLDNIKLYKTYDWGGVGQTTDYVLTSIVPLLFTVFLLIVIAGMALTGTVSIEAMIALMMAAIIGIICTVVVLGLY